MAALGGFALITGVILFFFLMFLCILGGFSTLVASFLARARGSNEIINNASERPGAVYLRIPNLHDGLWTRTRR
jgi:hypothetical protein